MNLLTKLRLSYLQSIRYPPTIEEVERCHRFQEQHDMKGCEIFFCPEEWFYEDILKLLKPDDVVFDVGAGDLRFDLMMAEEVRKVYAVEINPVILARALKIIGFDMPANLIVICGNAFKMELPPDVTVVTCLMIHRQHDFPESWLSRRIIFTRRDGIYIWSPEISQKAYKLS